jgi:hypothetical protein
VLSESEKGQAGSGGSALGQAAPQPIGEHCRTSEVPVESTAASHGLDGQDFQDSSKPGDQGLESHADIDYAAESQSSVIPSDALPDEVPGQNMGQFLYGNQDLSQGLASRTNVATGDSDVPAAYLTPVKPPPLHAEGHGREAAAAASAPGTPTRSPGAGKGWNGAMGASGRSGMGRDKFHEGWSSSSTIGAQPSLRDSADFSSWRGRPAGGKEAPLTDSGRSPGKSPADKRQPPPAAQSVQARAGKRSGTAGKSEKSERRLLPMAHIVPVRWRPPMKPVVPTSEVMLAPPAICHPPGPSQTYRCRTLHEFCI